MENLQVSEDISNEQKEYLRLPTAYWDATILKVQNEKVRDTIYKYVKAFPEVRKEGIILSIHGERSTGKSSLAAVIAKSAVASGYTGLFINADNLHDFVQDKEKIDDETYISRALNCDFLVIDDFKEKRWNVVRILRERYEWKRPTIIVCSGNEVSALVNYSFGGSMLIVEMKNRVCSESRNNLINMLQ